MSIAVFISTDAVNRLIRQLDETGIMPDMKGRVGRSDFLHACFSASMASLPKVETVREGALTIHAPVDGSVSVPWGMGWTFSMRAVTDLGLEVIGDKLKVNVSDLVFEDLRLGRGCSLPKKVLDFIGPFIHSMLFRGIGLDERQLMDLPSLNIPLSMAKPGAPPMEMRVKGIEVMPAGITAYVGMADDTSAPAPMPPTEGWDLTVAVCEGTAEDMVTRAMETIGNLEGSTSFSVPDSKQIADLLFASAQTLTTLGRRGLGRRALRSSSTIEMNYVACIGRPNLSFGDGEKVILSKIPAHVCAKADLVVENFKGSWSERLRAFFRPVPSKQAQVERRTMNSWDIDGNFFLERAEVKVVQEDGVPPRFELAMLDLENMNLPLPFPDEIMEKVAEGMGKAMISARLPEVKFTELPLSPELPFRLKLDNIHVSTCSGRLTLHANIGLVPDGDLEAFKKAVEERISAAIQSSTATLGRS